MRRWCRLLLVLAGLVVGGLVLAGCQAEAALHIDVNEDGSGVVTASVILDAEAASRTVLFESPPLVEDLKVTGWNVAGPTPLPDGTYQMTASKTFSRADQLHGVIEELAGPNGAFRDFELDRATSFAKRSWTLTGTVDLTKGLASFSDDELNAQLGGPPLGPDKAAQDAALGRTLESIIHVTVQARLPGELDSHNGTVPNLPRGAPATTTITTAPPASDVATTVGPSTSSTAAPPTAGPVIWEPSFADPAPLDLEARSTSSQLAPRLWRWLAAAVGIVGVAVLVYQLSFAGAERVREHRRTRRRRVRPLPTLQQPEPELEGLGAVMTPEEVDRSDVTPAGVGAVTASRPMPPPTPGASPGRPPRTRLPDDGAPPSPRPPRAARAGRPPAPDPAEDAVVERPAAVPAEPRPAEPSEPAEAPEPRSFEPAGSAEPAAPPGPVEPRSFGPVEPRPIAPTTVRRAPRPVAATRCASWSSRPPGSCSRRRTPSRTCSSPTSAPGVRP